MNHNLHGTHGKTKIDTTLRFVKSIESQTLLMKEKRENRKENTMNKTLPTVSLILLC